jgi:hydroxymethylglutaryl-CoA lyase
MQVPSRVWLREVGPRDGLQNEPPVPTAGKIELLDALSKTGLRRIEAVSFVHPRAIPQMGDAAEVWAAITRSPDVTYSALVPNLVGARRAVDVGVREIEVVVSASDSHNRANLNRTTRESLDELAAIIALAHENDARCQVIIATSWGCPYEGDVPVERTLGVAQVALEAGADALAYGDTTGMATPTRVEDLVGPTQERFAGTPLLLHFHNTRGTGLANLLTALRMGVTEFDASVGGLGGCPYAPGASGNIATEEVVHMLEDMGVETGVNLDLLLDVAARAEQLVGHQVPSQVLRAGPRDRTVPFPEAAAEEPTH